MAIPTMTTTTAAATTPTTPLSTVATKPGPTTSLAPAQSSAGLFKRATQEAVREGWFHAEVASTDVGISSTISQGSGLSSGHQSVTQAGGHLDVIVIGTALYLRGDTAGLTAALDIAPAEAGRYANMWISIPTGDGIYANAAEGVTIPSVLSQVALSGPIQIGAPTELNGTAVVGLSGQSPGPDGGTSAETLYVSTGANPLPVEVTDAASDGSTLKATFSQCGVAVLITAPTGAIPISTIPGAA